MPRLRRLALTIIAIACSAPSFWGQTPTASLRGTVSDPKGAVLPDASLTLVENQTGTARSAKTDSEGAYQFLQLPPATYSITVSA